MIQIEIHTWKMTIENCFVCSKGPIKAPSLQNWNLSVNYFMVWAPQERNSPWRDG